MHGVMRMTDIESNIPVSRLKQLLDLDPVTGNLFWKSRDASGFEGTPKRSATALANHWNVARAGKPALNCKTAAGYFSGRIDDKFFLAHRVVFALCNGHWPLQFIDHVNGCRSDNRPENLRDVSHLENQLNKQLPAVNTSGVIGVQWSAPHQKWRAVIKHQGKRKHLGMFASLEEAALARRNAEATLGFHKNHGRNAA